KEKTSEEIGKFKIDLFNPEKEYQINDKTKVQVLEYYPDFELSKDKVPTTKSPNPDNPAFILNVISPATPNGEKAWLFLGSYLGTPGQENVYGYDFNMPDLTNITGLMVRKDKSLPVIYFGCFIWMVGVIMGFYWQHRRIWVQTERGTVYIAGHTNKNYYGLRKELVDAFRKASIDISLDTRKDKK
ncbi:MAG TPA: cytochrome c biogenesis protein ResB, partial [Bacillota bacterium]|nr:cytochrome c biogenesis protein ResB [Bacillota bacterium]